MALPHGRCDINTDGNLIVVKACGSFNVEGVKLFVSAITQTILSLKGQPFCLLMDDTLVEGGTSEAYAALNEYNEWLNNQPLLAKAFIINSKVKKGIILSNSPAIHTQNIAFFPAKSAALEWLATTHGCSG